MHIFFSGIGGAGIGPLALIAHKAGYRVSGSDKRDSTYIHYLREHGISDISIGQTSEAIAAVHHRDPIDWYVYSSAVAIEQPDGPELTFCRKHDIKMTKRDELLNAILSQKKLKLIAIAGTHGKTTTTAMAVWALKQLGVPVSYSIGAKIGFGDMGEYDLQSEYFVYEADEYDRNFLAFSPDMSLITGIDWDHPDIYPTREEYNQAFRDFLAQTQTAVLWQADIERLGVTPGPQMVIIHEDDPAIDLELSLAGQVNRQNAWQVAWGLHRLLGYDLSTILRKLDAFPGAGRRFERIARNVYSDYAHTPPKLRGALQTARETASDNVVVVYEGIHNSRQHFILDELHNLFDNVKHLYIVPTYLGREDPSLELLTPERLKSALSEQAQVHTTASQLDDRLAAAIAHHAAEGSLVIGFSAGGGGSLDEWLRAQFAAK